MPANDPLPDSSIQTNSWDFTSLSNPPALAWIALLLSASLPAGAESLLLKRDEVLSRPEVAGADAPLFFSADHLETVETNVIEARGNVEIRHAGRNLFAEWLRYDMNLNQVEARDDIRLETALLFVEGDYMRLDLDDYSGMLTHPVYQLQGQPGRGSAEQIDFLDRDRYTLKDARYTTCPVDNDDWFIKVGELEIDRTREVATARNLSLNLLGKPILYAPWADFPLSDARKSGMLPPTFGTTESGGLEVLAPYYVNLAPNYDATLFPRIMSKRGFQLGGEFRYLTESMQGENRAQYLADDRVADRSRWSLALDNTYRLNSQTQMAIRYDRVSDDDYFRDLSNQISITSITNLNQEFWLLTKHANWQAVVGAQDFQTLQDSSALEPIVEPYARLPYARLGLNQYFANSLQFKLETEATRFAHSTLTEGTRVLAYPILRMPMANSYGFFTPQIGWHSTYYWLDDSQPDQRISRNLPILSLDSGIVLERPFSFSGRAYEQTLEPRVYYVYAPYRDQNDIPIFDTAQLDFSYAQMFTENQFIGGDRVNDANQLTIALTSRLIEADSGLERVELTLGQRYYFSNQLVTLPGVAPRDKAATDLLATISGQVNRQLRVDAGVQFDTDSGNTIRQNLGLSYRPAPGKTLNFGYRFIDQSTEQIDLSGQWPLSSRWYGVFRYNYSIEDSKLVEGLAGLEYNGGCWALRGVVQRLATKEDSSTDSFFLQLELSGMGRIGINPLDVLKQSVPGYRSSNELTENP
jgi:LPS-assembly protein